jgi:hypothetical protein
VSNVSKQLIATQKQKLLNQGKNNVKGLLSELIGEKSTKIDSTKSDSIATKDPITKNVKSILGGLLGGNKKKKDTIQN